MLSLLRPKPFRGDTVAAGTVALTVLVLLLELRFSGTWADGVQLAYTALAAALVLGMSVAAPREPAGPPAWHATLYVAGFLLTGAALLNLATVLGGDGGAGTYVWVGAALTTLATWMSRRRDAASGTLLAALTGIVTTAALLDFAFSPDGVTAYRYLLLGDVAILTLMALWQRIRGPAHGVQLLNAIGIALLAIAALFAVDAFSSLISGLFAFGAVDGAGARAFGGIAWGWTLLMLAGGVGILAAGAADRERGNVLVGILVLIAFTVMAGRGNLVGWPMVLAAAAAILLVIGLRPSTPLPDEPPPGAGGGPAAGPPAPLPVPPPR